MDHPDRTANQVKELCSELRLAGNPWTKYPDDNLEIAHHVTGQISSSEPSLTQCFSDLVGTA
jgi:hypothetical protein